MSPNILLPDLMRLSAGSAAVFLALLFARAALHKASDVGGFEGVLATYGLAPFGLVGFGARALPALEFLCAVLLLTPAAASLGAALGIALLCLYAGAMAFNLTHGRRLLDCGCGGTPLALSWKLVGRNVALAAVAAPAALSLGRALDWREAIVVAGGGAAAWLVSIAAEQLAANHARMSAAGSRTLWAFEEAAQ